MKTADEAELPDPLDDVSTVTKLKRSPLTDPRSLVLSLVVHAILLAITSVLALRVVVPRDDQGTGQGMVGELDATDNRAKSDTSGGSGDPEGRAADVSAEPGIPAPPTRDPAADALLSEILPTRDSAEMTLQTLPGSSTSGLGMLNGTGSGEGAGQGGGVTGLGAKTTGLGTE